MPPDANTPVTVAADTLPTVQINGVVWQQLVIGNTVYVAGSFTSARPAGADPGVGEVPKANLLAYDLTTGALITTFVADLNAQAKVLAKSPDGTVLYVGGDFTTVNGVARSKVAALDPTTGTPLPYFAPTLNNQVKAIVATSSTVYLGGAFSTINGTTRNRIGAVTTTGALVAGFSPKLIDGAVQAMVMSPGGTKLVLGGSFTTLNGSGSPGYGLGAVDPTSGTSLPFNANTTVRDAGTGSAIMSLSADANNVYGSGYIYGGGGNLEGAFSANWSDTNLKWLEDCHGDTYGVYPSATVVYTASHSHMCGNVGAFPETTPRSYHHALAWTLAATGTVTKNTTGSYFNFAGQPAPTQLYWYPDMNTGTYTGQGQGPWTVTTSGSYVLYGGEFTTVNSAKQQGLVRFATKDIAPNKQGPRANTADFLTTAIQTQPDTVQVSWPSNWDRDNSNLTYTVYEDKVAIYNVNAISTFWNRTTMSYTVTGVTPGSHTFKVSATDPFGNTVMSSPVKPYTIPTVTATTPTTGATLVPIGTDAAPTPLTATFSEDVTGVSATSFTLKQGTTAVTGTVSYDSTSHVATLVPSAPLVADQSYTLSLTTDVKSATGGPLAAQSWSFATGPAPTVTFTTPVDTATAVSRSVHITATFSEAITGIPTTAAASANYTIKKTSTGAAVTSVASFNSTTKVATLNPTGTLSANTQYTVTLSSAIKDTVGNPFTQLSWSFTTGPT